MLSEALAETVTEFPVTVTLFAGAVKETVGGVMSGTGLLTVTLMTAEVVEFPAASRATAVKVCAAFVVVFESHVIE